MRTVSEIDADIAHVEYAKALLDERLEALKTERDPPREDSCLKKRSTKKLAEFFKSRGLFIVAPPEETRTKAHYPLAKQIWRSRSALLPFTKTLFRQGLTPFSYDTQTWSPLEKTDLKNLCDELMKHGFLSYEIKQDCLDVVPNVDSVKRQFCHGAWAEEVTLYLVDKTLNTFAQSTGTGHKLFWDIKLKWINSDSMAQNDMQLDLVAEVGDRFYVFETKSGFVLSIDKWVDRTRLFDDDKTRFITCTADDALNERIFSPFCLFAMQTLEKQFLEMLMDDFKVTITPKAEVDQK
jgi:hypothetical protein